MSLRFRCLAVLLLLLLATRASAQCPGDALLDPQGPGANGQTRLENFYTLVDDLYSETNVTRRLFLNGKWHQAAPWFQESHVCGEADLHTDPNFPSPTWLRVSTVSQNRLDLLWQDNSATEAGFKVERKEGCCGPWTLLSPAAANATTYSSTGLSCGTSYAYRVWAFNGAGDSAKTNEAATTTQPCP